MKTIVLDMPYEVTVHGVPRRRRTADIWYVRRTAPVEVSCLDTSECAAPITLVRKVRAQSQAVLCPVVDRRLLLPLPYTPASWGTELVVPMRTRDGLGIDVNPTPVDALAGHRISRFHEKKIVPDEFAEILESDEDERRAEAVVCGSHLALIDGVVHTSRYEIAEAMPANWNVATLIPVDKLSSPSDLAARHLVLREFATQVPTERGELTIGDPDSYDRVLPYLRIDLARVAADCLDLVFPAAGAGTAAYGNGRPGSSDTSDELEDACYGLRNAVRLVDDLRSPDETVLPTAFAALQRFLDALAVEDVGRLDAPRIGDVRRAVRASEALLAAKAGEGRRVLP